MVYKTMIITDDPHNIIIFLAMLFSRSYIATATYSATDIYSVTASYIFTYRVVDFHDIRSYIAIHPNDQCNGFVVCYSVICYQL